MDSAVTGPNDKEWRTCDLIRPYWTVETDETLRLDSETVPPKVQAEWYSYKLGALASGSGHLLPSFEDAWGDGFA